MSPVISEPISRPHLMLSTRLVYELGDPHSRLRATTDRCDGAVLINAGGEIDACNEDTWRHLVTEAANLATAPGPLVVDVTGIDFMGCCAVAVLAEQAQLCHRRGIELRVVSRQPVVARMIDACGLRGLLPIYPTKDSALGDAHSLVS